MARHLADEVSNAEAGAVPLDHRIGPNDDENGSVFRKRIKRGANVNAIDSSGANASLRDKDGKTPVQVATHKEIRALFQKK